MCVLWMVIAVVFMILDLLALPHTLGSASQDLKVWLEIALQAVYLVLGILVSGGVPTTWSPLSFRLCSS